VDAAGASGEVTLGVRPETFCLAGAEGSALEMDVRLVEELGADAFVHGEVAIGGTPTKIIVRTEGREAPSFGDTVRVGLRGNARVHAFDASRGERLPG
jgi:multiple sugar transport system ATP-binding protein